MNKFLLILFTFITVALHAQIIGVYFDGGRPLSPINTGKDLITYMLERYKNGPCKAYTFSQKNTHYRNDSVIGNSEWHEAIEMPDKFRINFGDTAQGNFVVFKNDSSYSYKKFELKRKKYDSNTILLLLGGMYYRELKDVLLRLKSENYNTDVLSTQKREKEEMYVIGALAGDTLSNQIWVSKKFYRVERIIERMDAESIMDMTFNSFKRHCDGYTETRVTFKRNGKIEQVEEYYNIKTVKSFPEKVFNP